MKNTKKLASALVLGSALLFGNLAYAKESVFVTKEDCDKHYSRLVKDRERSKKEGLYSYNTSVKELEIDGYYSPNTGFMYIEPLVYKGSRVLYACEKVYGNNENKK